MTPPVFPFPATIPQWPSPEEESVALLCGLIGAAGRPVPRATLMMCFTMFYRPALALPLVPESSKPAAVAWASAVSAQRGDGCGMFAGAEAHLEGRALRYVERNGRVLATLRAHKVIPTIPESTIAECACVLGLAMLATGAP
jgi:hypothetical protein